MYSTVAVVIRQVLLLGGANCRAKIFEKNMDFCLQGGFQDIQMAFRQALTPCF
jgi:hypothetical protein